MKKRIFGVNGMMSTMMLAVMTTGMTMGMTACSSGDLAEDYCVEGTPGGQQPTGQRVMTFSVGGDMEFAGFGDDGKSNAPRRATTRAAISADGKQMTDLWVLDYVGGELRQQLHQESTDVNFGEPTLTMAYGEHKVYFVCSRGKTPAIDTEAHTLTWGTPSDTFWQAVTVTVAPSSAATQNVTLSRVATKLNINIVDVLPEGLTNVAITPATWYYGLDYLTGAAADAHSSEAFTLNIPASYAGRTNTGLTIFGISSATEWTTDVAIRAANGNGETLGTARITAAPMKANRATSYSGNLFAKGGSFALSLNSEWSEEVNGEW